MESHSDFRFRPQVDMVNRLQCYPMPEIVVHACRLRQAQSWGALSFRWQSTGASGPSTSCGAAPRYRSSWTLGGWPHSSGAVLRLGRLTSLHP